MARYGKGMDPNAGRRHDIVSWLGHWIANQQNASLPAIAWRSLLASSLDAGSRQLDPVFEQTAFRLDYLTRPNAFSDMGFDFGKARPWHGSRLTAGALAALYHT